MIFVLIVLIDLWLEAAPLSCRESECQAEFDVDFTVRALGDLDRQGLPESYEPVVLPTLALINGYSESFQQMA